MRLKILVMILAVLVLAPLPTAAQDDISYTWFETSYIDNGLDDSLSRDDGPERIDLAIGEGDGFGLRGSMALTENVHVFAGYAGSDIDIGATATADWPSLDAMRAAFFTTPDADYWDALCDLNGDGMINVVDLGLLRAAGPGRRVLGSTDVGGDVRDWRVGIGVNRMLTPTISGYAQLHWNDRDLDVDTVALAGEMVDFGASDNGFGATLGARGRVMERLELKGHVTHTPVGDIDLLADKSADRLDRDTIGGLAAELWFTDALSMTAGIEGDADTQAWRLGVRYDMRAGY